MANMQYDFDVLYFFCTNRRRNGRARLSVALVAAARCQVPASQVFGVRLGRGGVWCVRLDWPGESETGRDIIQGVQSTAHIRCKH